MDWVPFPSKDWVHGYTIQLFTTFWPWHMPFVVWRCLNCVHLKTCFWVFLYKFCGQLWYPSRPRLKSFEVIWSQYPRVTPHSSIRISHQYCWFFRNISTKKPHISWENQKGFDSDFPLNQSISPRLRQPWQSPRAFRGCQASHPLLFGRPPGAGSFTQTMKRRARPPLFFLYTLFLIFLLNLGFWYFVFWFLSFDVKHCHSFWLWLWDLWMLIPPFWIRWLIGSKPSTCLCI